MAGGGWCTTSQLSLGWRMLVVVAVEAVVLSGGGVQGSFGLGLFLGLALPIGLLGLVPFRCFGLGPLAAFI